MKKSILFLLVAAFAISSCNLSGYKKTKSGLYYKIISSGGKKLANGQFVKIYIKAYVHDSLFYNSYETMPYYNQVDSVGRPYDISEIFHLMAVGDSAVTIQAVDSIMKLPGVRLAPFFRKGDKLKTTFKVAQSFDNMEAMQKSAEADKLIAAQKAEAKNQESYDKAKKELDEYIAKNKINAVKTAHGVYVEVKQAGTGESADSGRVVGVKYRGTLLDGTLFDTNMGPDRTDTLTFPIAVGGMIQGFDEGVKGQKVGSQLRIYIPAQYGYGPQSRGDVIKPFSNLIFDINVLSVRDMEVVQNGKTIVPPPVK